MDIRSSSLGHITNTARGKKSDRLASHNLIFFFLPKVERTVSIRRRDPTILSIFHLVLCNASSLCPFPAHTSAPSFRKRRKNVGSSLPLFCVSLYHLDGVGKPRGRNPSLTSYLANFRSLPPPIIHPPSPFRLQLLRQTSLTTQIQVVTCSLFE